MDGEPGLRIAGYDEFVEIGRGGFATVYRARQVRLRRLVAVKVLSAAGTSEDALHRFAQECEAIGALSGHRNVVAVHDAGTTDDGRPYLAMEHLPAGSLADRLDEGPMPTDEVLAVGVALADALAAAHQAHVLHRDVKPANVLLGPDGTPKLADFGIAVVADAHQTATGVVIGTVLHSAPEVVQGQRATVATDVYSLASTLHALLRGRAAFAGDHDEGVAPVMYRVVHEPVPDLRAIGVPATAAAVLEQGMAKEPGDRFRTASAFRRALQDTAGRLTPTGAAAIAPLVAPVAPPSPAPTPPPPPSPPPTPAPVGPADRSWVVPAPTAPPSDPAWAAAPPTPGPPTGAPPAGAGPDGSPPSRAPLVAALVLGALLLVVVAVTGTLLLSGDDAAGPTTTPPPTPATAPVSSAPSTSAPSTAAPTTAAPTTSTSTTTTSPPTTTTTTPPTTTTEAPRAFTVEEAAGQVAAEFPLFTIIDPSGFRSEGAGVLVGEEPGGRTQAFMFGDGRLLGRDTSDPSWNVTVVGVGGDQVALHYDLWPPGSQPPDEPRGEAVVTLTWDGGERYVPDRDFPSVDPSVDGHR